ITKSITGRIRSTSRPSNMDPAAFRFRKKIGATSPESQHTSESMVPARLSCLRLKFVELGALRFNELCLVDRKWLVQHLAQFLSQNDGDGAGVLRVNGDRK